MRRDALLARRLELEVAGALLQGQRTCEVRAVEDADAVGVRDVPEVLSNRVHRLAGALDTHDGADLLRPESFLAILGVQECALELALEAQRDRARVICCAPRARLLKLVAREARTLQGRHHGRQRAVGSALCQEELVAVGVRDIGGHGWGARLAQHAARRLRRPLHALAQLALLRGEGVEQHGPRAPRSSVSLLSQPDSTQSTWFKSASVVSS
mmetsp:Transcript_11544/g.29243  ORF Transcript_11544/g.29243 Transcript_11544/m.29243 type:complete len:213 (+) Transcript_11544:2578-3216(+)